MTFTEAAIEVLRLVGKPLHYKKITEVAIERDLLSHVGKTPEVTMSSRLATLLKKDRGDGPLVKVKPGVFGLREFSDEVLKAAERESGHDYELPPEPEAPQPAEEDAEAGKAAAEDEAPKRALPGSEVFPEEDGDDDPILAGIGDEEKDGGDDSGRKKRRRRRRKRKDEDGGDKPSNDASSDGDRRGSGRSERSERSDRRRRGDRPSRGKATEVEGDWQRAPAEGDLAGRGLADAIASVVEDRAGAVGYRALAEELVERGRLKGDPRALAPTVAAAIRGDVAARAADGSRPRFRPVPAGVMGTDALLGRDALRAERDAVRAAERQREGVRREFLRNLAELPTAGLVEVIASWLNAEGVSGLRAVRPPAARGGEIHLAGTLRRGPEELRLAVVVFRDGGDLTRERVMELRGGLHHYGDASAAWLVTTGLARSGARDEAGVAGQAPCAIYDGVSLARAMERLGIGFRRYVIPVLAPDEDLLEALRGPRRDAVTPAAERPEPLRDGDAEDGDGKDSEGKDSDGDASGDGDGKRRKRRRRRGRGGQDADREATADAEDAETGDDDGEGEGDEARADDDADDGSRRRRRGRRRGRRGGGGDDDRAGGEDRNDRSADDDRDRSDDASDGDDRASGESDDDDTRRREDEDDEDRDRDAAGPGSDDGSYDGGDEDSDDDDSDDDDGRDDDSGDDDSDDGGDEDSDDDDDDDVRDEDSDDDDDDDDDSDDEDDSDDDDRRRR